MAKKTMEDIVAQIESDIQMTVKRRAYAYSSEHAYYLDRAAKRLLKIEDNKVRIELFMKIVRRALKLLKVVDDSSGSLQSVLFEGSYLFKVWLLICKESDECSIKEILKKVLPEDNDGLADGIFFPESLLPIPDAALRNLLEYVSGNIKFSGKYRRDSIVEGCLGWLAQLKDEEGFEKLCKSSKSGDFYVWKKRFNLYLNLGRYSDAEQVVEEHSKDNFRYRHELMLQIFERNGDVELFRRTLHAMAHERPGIAEFKRIKGLAAKEELSLFVDEVVKAALKKDGFDMSICEVLFEAGELKSLHDYVIARYDDIYNVYRCTGMIPLGKKLFKAGDPLLACIFLRGAIFYLMSRGNSKYYSDIHMHLRTLAEMSQAVSDWESVEPPDEFNASFPAQFASRKSFWF
jgi:hypothetical protein